MGASSETNEELRARVRQQEVVAELGQQALESDDLDQLLHDATVAVAETLDNDYCKVLELLPGGDEALLRQGVGWRDGLVGSAAFPTDRDSQAGHTLRSERPVIVDDLRTESRFSGPELLTNHDVVSGVSVVIGSVENPWGVLGTHATTRREFTDHDANFVQSVANVLASAIDNERTKRRLREREEELERYRAYTDDILDAVDDVFYVVDQAGQYQRWNDAMREVTGYSDEEIEVLAPTDAVVPEDREAIVEGIAEIFETGSARVEAAVLTKDGERIPHEFVASALTDPDENRVLVGIGRDITDREEKRRQLEETIEKLEASNRRLEQFAYAASHDLQEPLRMVSSYLKLIEGRYADALDEDGEEFLAFALDGADRMREMIDGLLKYSRVETGGNEFESVDLDAVFENVVDDLQVQVEDSGAEITATALPRVDGDARQLRQVFQNLLTNAMTYSGEDPPRVHVSAERNADQRAAASGGTPGASANGNEWVISVRDEGVGIHGDDADRIFEVFQRLHSRDEIAGTGIGLALARRIVERHGGRLWVDSEPGEGSTFYFTLPRARDEK